MLPPTALSGVVADARRALSLGITPTTTKTGDPLRSFNKQLGFARDLVSRLRCLDAAFHRLTSLSAEVADSFERLAGEGHEGPGLINLSKVSTDTFAEGERLITESEIETLYIFYELANVKALLAQWTISVRPDGEVAYIAQCRNIFLVHPRKDKATRSAGRQFGIGGVGIQRIAMIGLNGLPRAEIAARGYPVDGTACDDGFKSNEQLVRSGIKNEKFTPQQIELLEAYGLREPDLELALVELAQLLLDSVLPVFEKMTQRAVSQFGYSHLPWIVR